MFGVKKTNRVMMTCAGLLLAASGSSAFAKTYYVNANNPGVNNDGSSWTRAARHLNDVLPVAQAGDEIWVAAGVYYPDRTILAPLGTGDRDASFVLVSGVKVLGGFVGVETSAAERDPGLNITMLSGDIGVAGVNTDNARTIMTAINVDDSCMVDGFTFAKGYCSDGSSAVVNPNAMGGGIYMSNSALHVTRCVFDQNFARGGAGIAAVSSSPTITFSSFKNGWGDSRGGGIEFTSCPDPIVQDCEFRGNTAYFGGGIYCNQGTGGRFDRLKVIQNISTSGGGMYFAGFSDTLVANTLFLKNESVQITFYQQAFNGGAVQNWCAGTTFVNCVFNSNYARGKGGAVYDAGPSGSSSTAINCTFYNNSSRDGGVVASASGHVPAVRNGVVWGNVTASFDGSVAVTDTVNGSGGLMFVDADGADDTAGTEDDDLRLQPLSSWINAGVNAHIPAAVTTDFHGQPRINDDIVDLGAIEWYAPPPPFCPGDADGSRMVDFNDINTVIANWLGAGPLGDANDDQLVNFDDISTVVANFNSACPD